jgi:pilus assembly protein Flp/PilA
MLELYAWPAQKLQAIEDESGATAVEYALIAAGIALAIIVGVGLIGDELAVLFNSISSQIL